MRDLFKQQTIPDVNKVASEKTRQEYKDCILRIKELNRLQDIKYDNDRQSEINRLSVKASIKKKQMLYAEEAANEQVNLINRTI